MSMTKTILITGGSGFVGAGIVRKLVREKWDVHVILRKGSSLQRISDIADKIKIHYDLLHKSRELSALMKKKSPFAIYHLATHGAYPNQHDAQTMIDINVKGTMNLLQSLVGIDYKHLIVAGSSSEYGGKDNPMKETDYLEPNNFYAATKAAQTLLCQAFAKKYKKSVAILRLFSVYGPAEEKGRFVRSVIESVLSNKKILLASGKEARDFIFIEDVVRAFLHTTKQKKRFDGEIFNIGTGIETTTHQLASHIVSLVGRNIPIQRNAYQGRSWDVYHWRADMTKTNRILRWKPSYSLDQGLAETIQWYESNLQMK